MCALKVVLHEILTVKHSTYLLYICVVCVERRSLTAFLQQRDNANQDKKRKKSSRP
jgi:hypothetical protein